MRMFKGRKKKKKIVKAIQVVRCDNEVIIESNRIFMQKKKKKKLKNLE